MLAALNRKHIASAGRLGERPVARPAKHSMGAEMAIELDCQRCGACCAHFRVSFYWAEADDAPTGSVPVALTEDLNGLMRCMKGTNQREPRCAALVGCVGESVRCAIYEQRPTACREFGVKWSRGALHFSADELER